jgi:hypothetical protein
VDFASGIREQTTCARKETHNDVEPCVREGNSTMSYRNKTYVIFDGDNDQWACQILIRCWPKESNR